MAKTQKKAAEKAEAKAKPAANNENLKQKLVLSGADIKKIGEEAELLVGGKNYNTAIISQVPGIRAPEFRAISSHAFHHILDETKVNAAVVRATVDKEYNNVDWHSDEVNQDFRISSEFCQDSGQEDPRAIRQAVRDAHQAADLC